MTQKIERSISLRKEKNIEQNMIVLIPTCFLLNAGFFGVLFQEWNLKECGSVFLPIVMIAFLTAVILLAVKEKKRELYYPVLAIVLAAAVILVPVFRELFSRSMGTILNQMREWLYLRTGWYRNPFVDNANPWPILILFAVGAGVLTQYTVLHLRGRLVIITSLVYLVLLTFGAFEFNIWGLTLLLGCILTLAQGADGRASAGLWIIGGFLILGFLVTGICILFNLKGTDGSEGAKLLAFLHKNKYETTDNPMPEGNLRDLGAYKTSEETALTVSMDNWRTIYLRGFQGGTYTGISWEPLSPKEVDEEKELINALQKDGLYASTQLAQAWKTIGKDTEESVKVVNIGACSAYTYLPYGAESDENLDPDSITGEGMDPDRTEVLNTGIYPLEDSYLLMQELSLSEDAAADYLEKESSYRSFVYEHYLDIPDRVQSLLTSHKLSGNKGVSTIQACREVKLLLKDTLKYGEGTVFYNHNNDFLDYLLNIQPTGYSVHYATLAVMMLRSYGIPARYVEGFYIPSTLTKELEAGDTYTVTQAQSSAWVEYYVDGVGWLMFDPVPTHTNTCNYNLPVGEGDSDQQIGNIGLSMENRKHQENMEEEERENGTEDVSETSRRGIRALQLLLGIFLVLLLILLLIMVIRSVILRRTMHHKRARFEDADPRVGTAAILCTIRGLTIRSLHIPEEEFFCNPDQKVTELLEISEEELFQWKKIADEIEFSRHPISEETRRRAAKWLKKTEDSWNAAVPLPRKIVEKYILCKVY